MGWNPSARAGTRGRQFRWDAAGCLAETWPAPADCADRGSALVKGTNQLNLYVTNVLLAVRRVTNLAVTLAPMTFDPVIV